MLGDLKPKGPKGLVYHLRVGWGMALLYLDSALPRWLVRAFALREVSLHLPCYGLVPLRIV